MITLKEDLINSIKNSQSKQLGKHRYKAIVGIKKFRQRSILLRLISVFAAILISAKCLLQMKRASKMAILHLQIENTQVSI